MNLLVCILPHSCQPILDTVIVLLRRLICNSISAVIFFTIILLLIFRYDFY